MLTKKIFKNKKKQMFKTFVETVGGSLIIYVDKNFFLCLLRPIRKPKSLFSI